MRISLVKFTGTVSNIFKRDLGIFAPALQKANDPIQQLFIDKIREYKSKSKDGKLVEPSPEFEKQLQKDRQKVYAHFRLKPGDNLSQFPSFNFKEPEIELPPGTGSAN